MLHGQAQGDISWSARIGLLQLTMYLFIEHPGGGTIAMTGGGGGGGRGELANGDFSHLANGENTQHS